MPVTPIARGFELEWRHQAPGGSIATINFVTRSTPGGGSVTTPCGMLTIYREPVGAEHYAHDIVTVMLINIVSAHAVIDGGFRTIPVDADPEKLADELAIVLARDAIITEPWVLYLQRTKTLTYRSRGQIRDDGDGKDEDPL